MAHSKIKHAQKTPQQRKKVLIITKKTYEILNVGDDSRIRTKTASNKVLIFLSWQTFSSRNKGGLLNDEN
jgi:hypothetical protein